MWEIEYGERKGLLEDALLPHRGRWGEERVGVRAREQG
jgi:hypothetical protein